MIHTLCGTQIMTKQKPLERILARHSQRLLFDTTEAMSVSPPFSNYIKVATLDRRVRKKFLPFEIQTAYPFLLMLYDPRPKPYPLVS